MCKFLSGITLENGDVKISRETDSHSEILKEFDIKDTDVPPSFVAWEFTPPIVGGRFDFYAPYDKWNFIVDGQFPKPDWWDKGRETLTIEDCKKELDVVMIRKDTEEIKSGRWIILGGTVNYILGGTVNDIRGGTVNNISDGTVKELKGAATMTIYPKYTGFKIIPKEGAVVIYRTGDKVKIVTAKKSKK